MSKPVSNFYFKNMEELKSWLWNCSCYYKWEYSEPKDFYEYAVTATRIFD